MSARDIQEICSLIEWISEVLETKTMMIEARPVCLVDFGPS